MARSLIVEADGGSRGNPGPAGYGALVRDAKTGELLREIGESIGVIRLYDSPALVDRPEPACRQSSVLGF